MATPREPAHPGWDIAFTRLWRQLSPAIASCLRSLASRFDAVGLDCESRSLLCQRSIATVMRVRSGAQGLFELEYSLVDGMQESAMPGAMLVLRLLDAEGQPLASGATGCGRSHSPWLETAAQIAADGDECLSAASVHEVVTRHFDLLHRRRRDPRQPVSARAAARQG